MPDSQKLSRRDWFRLRNPRLNKMLDEPDVEQSTDTANGLTPIELPPNHDGLDLSKLPPMREAVLSSEQVNTLLDDIGQFGSTVFLMQRSNASEQANASKVDNSSHLEIAGKALLSGSVQRIQIRYCWQNQNWIDTVKRTEEGFHLVRIVHQQRTS